MPLRENTPQAYRRIEAALGWKSYISRRCLSGVYDWGYRPVDLFSLQSSEKRHSREKEKETKGADQTYDLPPIFHKVFALFDKPLKMRHSLDKVYGIKGLKNI